MADLRHPQAKARDEFLESPEGRRLCDLGSLIGNFDLATLISRGTPYLRNRLEAAFLQGWHAAEAFHLKEP
jgi:hypothetical protein